MRTLYAYRNHAAIKKSYLIRKLCEGSAQTVFPVGWLIPF